MKSGVIYNQERIIVIAELFSRLGFDGITRFDYLEPEYSALKKIYEELHIQPKFLNLIALSAGTIDFQLGFGGADRFWSVLYLTANKLKKVDNVGQVEYLMLLFLRDPVNAKFLNIKRKRIERIFRGGFASWLINNYEYLRENPIMLWKALANSLDSPMDKKTIVFSMKACDIANLICHGDYLPFPSEIPIPVDFHVKCVSISAGLLNRYERDEFFRNAWNLVLNKVRSNLGKNITLLRLDSLVWQVGKIMYKSKYEIETSMKNLEEYLVNKVGIERTLAKEIATELTRFIDRVLSKKKI